MAEIVMERERVEGRNVSMYPREWATVHQVTKDMGLSSISAGLRRIVQEWQKLKTMQEAMEQYLRLESAYHQGIITRDEFMASLELVTIMVKRGGNGHGLRSDG